MFLCSYIDRYNFVSSTYDSISQYFTTFERSLTLRLNNTGPNIDPYGTTWVTVSRMEGEEPTESSPALNYANALLKLNFFRVWSIEKNVE